MPNDDPLLPDPIEPPYSRSGTATDALAWPSNDTVRPLTGEEISRLEHALGKPLDTGSIVWLRSAIGTVVRFSEIPTSKQAQQHCAALAETGHRFLELARRFEARWILGNPDDVNSLCDKLELLCVRLDGYAEKLHAVSGQGRHPAHPAFTAFLNTLIAIAKRTNIPPSTPSRAPSTQTRARRPYPPFFRFTVEAIAIAKDVIRSSTLNSMQRQSALDVLRYASEGALSKQFESLRGRIADTEK